MRKNTQWQKNDKIKIPEAKNTPVGDNTQRQKNQKRKHTRKQKRYGNI